MREHRWVTVVSFDRDYVQTGKVDLSDNLLTVTFRAGYQSGKMLYTADDQWQGYRKSIGKRRWFIGNQTEVRAVISRTSKRHPIRTTIIIAVLLVVSLAVGYMLGGAGSVSKVNRPTDEKLTIAVATIADNYANKAKQADYVASSVNDIASKELTQIDAYQVSEADAYLRRKLGLLRQRHRPFHWKSCTSRIAAFSMAATAMRRPMTHLVTRHPAAHSPAAVWNGNPCH